MGQNRGKSGMRGALLLAFLFTPFSAIAQSHADFFVSKLGNDHWTGRLFSPLQTGSDGPLATLEAARAAVRRARGQGIEDISVTVESGVYELASPLELSQDDSGTKDHPIVWKAAVGARVTLSGGRTIKAQWKRYAPHIYVADIPAARNGHWPLLQLFVDGRRATEARYPNADPEHPTPNDWLYAGGPQRPKVLAGLVHSGDFATFSFSAGSSGTFHIWLGAATTVQNLEKHLSVSVDGQSLPLELVVPSGSYRNVRYSHVADVKLSHGAHSIRIAELPSHQDFRLHLGDIVITSADLRFASSDLPAAAPAEQRIVINTSDEAKRIDSFSSEAFRSIALDFPHPDKSTIAMPVGSLKEEWASDPEAHVSLLAGLHYFNEILSIQNIDSAGTRLQVQGTETQETIHAGNKFFVFGVLKELDTPGEWYLDRKRGRLYYWPRSGEDLRTAMVVAPVLDRIVDITGSPDGNKQAEWITLRGFDLQYASARVGYGELRTAADGAVHLTNAAHIRIENNHIHNVDGFGVWLHLNSTDNAVDGNEIDEMGAGGVILTSHVFGYGFVYDSRPEVANYAPLRNSITGNHIHNGGKIRFSAAGFLLDSRPDATALEPGNLIAFNDIHDMPRQGLFAFRNQGGNIVFRNRFRNVVTQTADAGGINFAVMNNMAAPILISDNLVDGVTGLLGTSPDVADVFGGAGIYLDWGTSHATVNGNFVENSRYAGLLMNEGSFNTITRNVFLNDTRTPIFVTDGQKIGFGHRIEGNIFANTILSRNTPGFIIDPDFAAVQKQGMMPPLTMDHNQYWNAGHPVSILPFGDYGLWRATGHDMHSTVSDPCRKPLFSPSLTCSDGRSYLEADWPSSSTVTAPPLEQMNVARISLDVDHPSTSSSEETSWKFSAAQDGQYDLYVRFAAKANPTLTFKIDEQVDSVRISLADRLSLGRQPSSFFGVYLGRLSLRQGQHYNFTMNWNADQVGSLPSEILMAKFSSAIH